MPDAGILVCKPLPPRDDRATQKDRWRLVVLAGWLRARCRASDSTACHETAPAVHRRPRGHGQTPECSDTMIVSRPAARARTDLVSSSRAMSRCRLTGRVESLLKARECGRMGPGRPQRWSCRHHRVVEFAGSAADGRLCDGSDDLPWPVLQGARDSFIRGPSRSLRPLVASSRLLRRRHERRLVVCRLGIANQPSSRAHAQAVWQRRARGRRKIVCRLLARVGRRSVLEHGAV